MRHGARKAGVAVVRHPLKPVANDFALARWQLHGERRGNVIKARTNVAVEA